MFELLRIGAQVILGIAALALFRLAWLELRDLWRAIKWKQGRRESGVEWWGKR